MINEKDKIRHLHARVGFGLSFDAYQGIGANARAEALVDAWLAAHRRLAPFDVPPGLQPLLAEVRDFMDERRESGASKEVLARRAEVLSKARQSVKEVNLAWVRRMSAPDALPLSERMLLFWHDHFACTPMMPHFAVQYLNALQTHALGNFRELVLAVSRDAAMIRYLNNQQNKKESPNENYARELMELFTLGRGHYSEKDIQEAARAFTGWSSMPDGSFKMRPNWHDEGQKTFFGKTGNFDGTDIVDMILEKRECAQFITTKLYRYLVNEQQSDAAEIRRLSAIFYESDYDISALLRAMLTGPHFFAPQNLGNKIKSPIDWLVTVTRQLGLRFGNEDLVLLVQRAQKQILLDPPNVAGWPGGKSWIDNAVLMQRLNFVAFVMKINELDFGVKELPETPNLGSSADLANIQFDLEGLRRHFRNSSPADTLRQLADWMLATPASPATLQVVEQEAAQLAKAGDFPTAAIVLLSSLPEYQFC